jgi:hypothetical protein
MPEVVAEIMPGAGPFDAAGEFYLSLTGAAGSNATTTDTGALDITGDIDVRLDATLERWIALPGTGMELLGKFAPPSNQSWLLWVNSNRRLMFRNSADGTAIIDHQSSVAIPVLSGRLAVRATLDADDLAAGHTVVFYTAPTMAGPWSQLGVPVVTAGTTSIFNSTAPLGVGDVPTSGFARPTGRVHSLQVLNGIAGTAVANPDFTAQPPGTPSFADAAGRTWTVNSPATVAGFDWEPIPDDYSTAGARQRLKSLVWDVGRSNELDRFPAGRGTAVLRSNDRLLDPEYTAGRYFGQLLPRVPVRFRTVSPAADLYYGFPEDGWKQAYEKPKASRCTIDMTDLLGVISDMPLPQSAYEAEVLGDNPAAFWRLDEQTGNQMADSSGHGRHGIYDNGLLGQDPLVFGDGRAVEFPHVGDNRGRWSGEGLPIGAPCTLEAWVKTTRDAAATKSIIVAQRDASLGSALWFQIETSANGSPNGELVINFLALGTLYKARGHTRIDDDRPHHVVCTIGGTTPSDVQLYVDGVLQTKTTVTAGNPGGWTSHLLWTVGNSTDTGGGDWGFDGTVDEVAIYNYVLTADQIAAHYEAGTTAFDGDSTDIRINRVLDIIGVPAALRDIGVGDTTVGPATYNGDTVGAYLNKVIESEQGVLYVDHPGGGKLKFRGRYARLTETRSTTSQATFTDKGAGFKYRNDIAPEPNGMASIVNTVTIGWRGGTELASDDASIARYGPKSRTLTTEAPTPEAALSAGQWLIGRYSQPQSRIRRLPLGPGGAQAGLAAVVLGQQISDRITVKRNPQGVGAQVTNELIVEGIRNEMNPDQSWYATYTTSNADDTQVWIWGVSTWGETTVWG